MNKLHIRVFKFLTLACLLVSSGMLAQKQTKTYNESFKVGDEAVLDINTSYVDIEFDTWNKNEVVVEAIIELEGATEEEAADYFENNGIKILGNSNRIEISTSGERNWLFRSGGDPWVNMSNIVVEIPELPDLEPLFEELAIPELAELPPMPPMPPMKFDNFDYEKYKEDGEKYIEKWAKEYEKSFGKDFEKKWEEWGKRFAEQMEEKAARIEERRARQEERLKEREELREEREEVRREAMEQREKAMEDRRKVMEERREIIHGDTIRFKKGEAPSIFYRSAEGENKSFKVKKTIKIKMPKSTKLKMNVRYGEVKLAANTRNMHATLSYSRLLASTIDGDETNIVASFSPVAVQRWNYGKLNTSFSDDVALEDVQYLTLTSTSSDVTIGRLLKSALVKNNLGALKINAVNEDFKEMDISVQNGELSCALPKGPYTIYVEGTHSKLSSPAALQLNKVSKGSNIVHSGFHLDRGSNKSIKIDSKFSEVVLKQ